MQAVKLKKNLIIFFSSGFFQNCIFWTNLYSNNHSLAILIFNFGKVPQISTKWAFDMAFSIDKGIQKCMWNLCLTLPLYEIQHQNLTFYEAKIWSFLGLSQILPKFQNSKCHFVKTNRNNEKMTLDQSIYLQTLLISQTSTWIEN